MLTAVDALLVCRCTSVLEVCAVKSTHNDDRTGAAATASVPNRFKSML